MNQDFQRREPMTFANISNKATDIGTNDVQSYTGNAVITTTLDIERDEISPNTSWWIISEQMNCDLVSDESIKLLNGLTTETSQQ